MRPRLSKKGGGVVKKSRSGEQASPTTIKCCLGSLYAFIVSWASKKVEGKGGVGDENGWCGEKERQWWKASPTTIERCLGSLYALISSLYT
jgi:hypothetical protein